MNEEAISVLIKFDSKTYLMMTYDTPRSIQGFHTIAEAVDYFEKAYNDNHARGYESSMSACINYIFFQPSVVVFKNGVEDIKPLLVEPLVLHKLSCVAGVIYGLKLKEDEATKLWDAGMKPALI